MWAARFAFLLAGALSLGASAPPRRQGPPPTPVNIRPVGLSGNSAARPGAHRVVGGSIQIMSGINGTGVHRRRP
jgi:hypothetical protein